MTPVTKNLERFIARISPKLLLTSPYSPLKPLRMSQQSTRKEIFRLPLKSDEPFEMTPD